MRLHITDRSPLTTPFIVGGAVAGTILAGWYLYRTLHLPVPDPVWTRFVNVSLILFASIYGANLLRRLIDLMRRKGKGE